MKRLLRSVIDVDGKIAQEDLASNLQRIVGSRLEWARADDKKLYAYILGHFQRYLSIPSTQTIIDYFENTKDTEVEERIKDVLAAPSYTHSNFSHLLSTIIDEQNKIRAVHLLKEAQEIVVKGLTIDGEKKQGVRDGLQHFSQNANMLITPEHNAKLRGELRQDGKAVWDEYELAKFNKNLVWGRFCGLNEIDKVCHGIKKGELWIHAGYAGELKTSFATNWAYNLITRYRSNVFYVSLEMTYEHIRRLIYVIHSANLKWSLQGYAPLDYRKVRDGELSSAEEIFFKIVIEDFTTNPDYGSFNVWRPDDDVTISDIRMEAELQHKQDEIDLLIVDHGGLVEARKQKRNKDYTVELNSVIRDTKKLALNFNHGETLPILLLFQINRAGKDEADKSEGRYRMKALAQSNEAERSADVITTTYLNDDHRKNGTTLFCNLKNRDNPLFDPFQASVNFASRRIYNVNLDAPGVSVEDHRVEANKIWDL